MYTNTVAPSIANDARGACVWCLEVNGDKFLARLSVAVASGLLDARLVSQAFEGREFIAWSFASSLYGKQQKAGNTRTHT